VIRLEVRLTFFVKMNAISCQHALNHAYELRFQPLGLQGSMFAFPCDALGTVNLDTLSAKALNDYLFARHQVGRCLCPPKVLPLAD
jgi:hypothetical protein